MSRCRPTGRVHPLKTDVSAGSNPAIGTGWHTGGDLTLRRPARGREPDTVRGGHAICIVGYRSDGRFIVRNSWGPTWGVNGFGYLHPDYIAAAFYDESYGVTL